MIQFKQGASFAAQVEYSPADGAPVDLTGAVVTSQIRTARGLLANLDITISDDGMSFTAIAEDTSSWPAGVYANWDIRVAFGDSVVYTDTVTFSIRPSITKEPA